MSDLIIKIGDDALDLNVNETIAITKQAAKVGDFSTVLADGTNELTVGLTPNNKRIMDNAHLIPSDSNKPYGRLDATLIQEGYETIQDGYAIIKSSSNNFSLQVIGGNASFFDRIKDLNLRDLDLSEYDHFWTNQEVFDNRNNTEGLIYPIFEQGLDVNTMTTYGTNLYAVETELMWSCFYLKTYVEKIFEAQGYSFVTDLTGEDIYEKAALYESKIGNRGSDMTYHECTVRNDAEQVAQATDPETFRLFEVASIDAPTNSFTSGDAFTDALQLAGGKKFGVTDNCSLTIDISLIINNPGSIKDTRIQVERTTSTGIVTTTLATVAITGGVNTYTASGTFGVEEFEGDNYLTVVLEYVTPTLEVLRIQPDSTYTISDVELISNTKVTSIFPFNYLTNNLYILDMKQGDFLKEIAKIYQWVFDTDERTHTVTAKRFDEIKDNIPNAIDLSDKIHADPNTQKINYGIDGFAQTNALRYKEDDITKYDAVGYINVADTTLKPEKDYVKMSELAATSTKLRFDTVNAPYVPIFDEGLPTNELAPRIFLLRNETFAYNINFNRDTETPTDIPTTDVTFAYFSEEGNTDSLDMPNIISRFYQAVVGMNDKGKTFDCMVDLNIKDVQNYDPFIPVYIQSEGNYFYWEKLNNYVKDKLTKCIFVKI